MFDHKECERLVNDTLIKFSENKREFIAENIDKKDILKLNIDDCLIKNVKHQLSCDNGMFIESDSLFYFIELKGRDIRHACEQIANTIVYFEKYFTNQVKGKEFIAAMVLSKYDAPKLKQSPQYVKLRRKVKEIKIQSQVMKVKV